MKFVKGGGGASIPVAALSLSAIFAYVIGGAAGLLRPDGGRPTGVSLAAGVEPTRCDAPGT